MEWNAADILSFLYIAVGVMLVVVLYHILFVVVDLRKILSRIEGITSEVESMILKPLALTDTLLSWVLDMVEKSSKKKKK